MVGIQSRPGNLDHKQPGSTPCAIAHGHTRPEPTPQGGAGTEPDGATVDPSKLSSGKGTKDTRHELPSTHEACVTAAKAHTATTRANCRRRALGGDTGASKRPAAHAQQPTTPHRRSKTNPTSQDPNTKPEQVWRSPPMPDWELPVHLQALTAPRWAPTEAGAAAHARLSPARCLAATPPLPRSRGPACPPTPPSSWPPPPAPARPTARPAASATVSQQPAGAAAARPG